MRFVLRIISALFIFSYSPDFISAQSVTTDPPRLVIGIMVDGLQTKHIDVLWNYLEVNGIKKIIEKGARFENVSYNIVSAGNASDIATIMTGSTPYYNGIAGNHFFNKTSGETQSILIDENQIGIGTKNKFSAHHLLSSTINDELVLTTGKKSKTYAVAIGAEEAIMMGGHTAKSVSWIDDEQLKWVTTGYYSEGLSRWADEMNVNGLVQKMANKPWNPAFNINTYFSKPRNEDKKTGFEYDPASKKSKTSPASIIKNTPVANDLVTNLGIKILTEEKLGKDIYPDMLMLHYTVRTPNEKTPALQSAEKEDMYYRLDRNIKDLLVNVENSVGLDKTLIFLFANQTGVHSPAELGENKIPAGYFNARRSLALVSTYLMAIYGQQRWIEGYYGKNIFLNKKLIEEKNLNYNEITQNIANFMLEFEGIQTAFPSLQVLNMGGNANSEMIRIRNSTNKNSMGDVIFTLLPGWLEVDDKNNPVGESNSIVSHIPLYFYGWKINQQKITRSYQTTDIAPTLSKILNIPIPNASIGIPMDEILP